MINLVPLTEGDFAPFGTVAPLARGRMRFGLVDELQNLRAPARPHLDFATLAVKPLPMDATLMERHATSSQSFVPIDAAAYLVLVAPADAGGRPDMGRARGFVAASDQSVTYRANVWHHPGTALERDGLFAILTFRAGDDADTEFFTLSVPVRVLGP